MSQQRSLPSITVSSCRDRTITTGAEDIDGAGRLLLIFTKDENDKLSFVLEPQVPNILPYAQLTDESLWQEYNKLCKQACRVQAALAEFPSAFEASAWLGQTLDEQGRKVEAYLEEHPKQEELTGCTIAIDTDKRWAEVSNSLCSLGGYCQESHMFSPEELALLKTTRVREPIYMEWVGIEHKNGPWTLRTKSCGDGTKELSSLDRTIQRALSRFRQVVKVYTETQASQSPATYEGRDPHEVLCDFAQRLKKHHPYVCDTELICVKAPQASHDDTAATSSSAIAARVHASGTQVKEPMQDAQSSPTQGSHSAGSQDRSPTEPSPRVAPSKRERSARWLREVFRKDKD